MTEEKNTLLGRINGLGKINRLIIALLFICLVMTSLPDQYYRALAMAAEMPDDGVRYEILSVSTFPEDIRSQTVAFGTPLKLLKMPGSLTVSCRRDAEEGQETPGEPETASLEGSKEAISGEQEEVERPVGSEISVEVEQAGSTATEPEPMKAEPESSGIAGEDSEPEGNMEEETETAGNTGTPEEPEENAGTEPEGAGTVGNTGASEEPEENAGTESEGAGIAGVGAEEGLEKAETISEIVVEGITWQSAPEYDAQREGTYVFTPVFPVGYRVSESLALPEIVVMVQPKEEAKESRERFYSSNGRKFAEEEVEGLPVAEDLAEIARIPAGQTETWDARTLSEGTVVVEENAVLAITGCITISGNVKITGGGTVQRGDVSGYFSVPSGASLALGNVTVDGCALSSPYSMITVSSGSLALEDGCVIQNSICSGDGGAISLNGVNAVFNHAVIKDCAASHRGGAIYMYHSNVDLHGTRFENCSVGQGFSSDQGGALYIYSGCKVDINGAAFEGCSAKGSGSRSAGGAFYVIYDNTVDIRDTVIENCSAGTQGGAFITVSKNVVNIYSGVFRNNSTTSTEDVKGNVGGGCLYNCSGTLNIYGGSFLDNYAINKGGFLNHCWEPGTITNITGGKFEGNHCDYKDATADYSGSGGIFNSSVRDGQAELTVSGNVKFSGDGTEGSGVDGIYLDQDSGVPRKIFISTTLTFPVSLFVKAVEGYVIAEGRDGYTFLHERDMKKIKFYDIGDSGVQWYAKLSDDKTKVMLTDQDPGYGYFVYYISNGATGNVVDDRQYAQGEEAVVQPDKDEDGNGILSYDGHTFLGWSKNEDGSGQLYHAGDSLGEMTEDIDLYAVFAENPAVDFYSGSAGHKVREEGAVDENGQGRVIPPSLEDLDDADNPDDMTGWEKAGWAEAGRQFGISCQPGVEIAVGNNKEFCGIYEKDVTLTYDKNGWDIESVPAADVKQRHARVYKEITYEPAEFTIAPCAAYSDYAFAGWNARPDGSGEYYHEDDKLTSEEDLTLYAIFTKSFRADFYSGGAGQKETRTARVGQMQAEPIRAPELKDMEGWEKVGWAEEEERFGSDIDAGAEIILTQHSSYYGVYRKDVTLSYDLNGGGGSLDSATGSCYANVHSEVSVRPAEFRAAKGTAREGYVFAGWNTQKDGAGEDFREGEAVSLTEDKTLYAQWEPAKAGYKVEHYKQGLDGNYLLAETEEAEAVIGTEVSAEAKAYDGFVENTVHSLRADAGIVAADGDLVLKLYYDRDIYEVSFDLNGAEGEAPKKQSVLYGAYLDKVEEPARRGYHFKGWFMDSQGLEGNEWDFNMHVEENYGRTVSDSQNPHRVKLYARWADETAPVLEDSAYNRGYVSVRDWVVRKKSLVITVPIVEEGSGVRQLDYAVSTAVGKDQTKSVGGGSVLPQSDEKADAAVSRQSDEKAGGKETQAAGGTIQIPESRQRVNLPYGVLTPNQGEFAAGSVRLLMKGGKVFAEVTVSEDFKGNIRLRCTDNAGNISSEKAIAASDGGVIVEDNAPKITFSSPDGKLHKTFSHAANVSVKVVDDANGRVTGGIASVSYRLDNGKEISVGKETFQGYIVETYKFDVKASGAGRHTLRVAAVDNAGNKSEGRVEVEIRKEQGANPVQTPPNASPGEPRTGDSMNVQVYATLAMIAGLSYLMLYFASDSPGITEEEKEELVSRLVRWAKRGGIARKLLSFAALFFFLLYYHSIGKNVNVEWDWNAMRNGKA